MKCLMSDTSPPCSAQSGHRLFLIRCDRIVVGEYDMATGQPRTIGGLKALHGVGLAVGLVRGLVFEDEEVYEPRRVFLVLPRDVHARAGLVFLSPGDELFNSLLDRCYALGADAVFGDGLDWHGAY